jgi:hypothetical protein
MTRRILEAQRANLIAPEIAKGSLLGLDPFAAVFGRQLLGFLMLEITLGLRTRTYARNDIRDMFE